MYIRTWQGRSPLHFGRAHSVKILRRGRFFSHLAAIMHAVHSFVLQFFSWMEFFLDIFFVVMILLAVMGLGTLPL